MDSTHKLTNSGVRYRIFSYHDYCTQYITIRYISRYTNSSLGLCIYIDDTCSSDVLEVQYNMVHDYHTTLQALHSIINCTQYDSTV